MLQASLSFRSARLNSLKFSQLDGFSLHVITDCLQDSVTAKGKYGEVGQVNRFFCDAPTEVSSAVCILKTPTLWFVMLQESLCS